MTQGYEYYLFIYFNQRTNVKKIFSIQFISYLFLHNLLIYLKRIISVQFKTVFNRKISFKFL